METGGEIFNVWVLRMIMLGLYITDDIPFKDVYIHGYVMAEDGSKMSKSVGNVVNPQHIIEEYGSDALRMGIVSGRKAGVNQNYSPAKFTSGRNFCNKLWNIARYVEQVVGDRGEVVENNPKPKTFNLKPNSPADHWIIRELNAASNQVATMLEEYRFSEAYETVYHTIWDKMADWYLEASKTALEPSVMVWALETCLKLAHPFAPFVTEAIWQTLDPPSMHGGQVGIDSDKASKTMLITTRWPERVDYDVSSANSFEKVTKLISEIREVLGVVGTTDIALISNESKPTDQFRDLIIKMTKVGYIQQAEESDGLRLTSTTDNVWLDLSADELQVYKSRLVKRLEDIDNLVHALEHRLSNQGYIANAPEALVEESREELQQAQNQAEHLRHQLKHL